MEVGCRDLRWREGGDGGWMEVRHWSSHESCPRNTLLRYACCFVSKYSYHLN